MVEEDENQGLKRIRFEEEEDEDRISKLPDCLLVEILSRLPLTKDAIRTGTLSKRWKHIWTSVSNLIFEHPLKLSSPNPDYSSFVDKTLSQRPQSNLNKFQLHTYYYYYYNDNNINNHSRINNWIRYAVTCNVQHIHLTLCGGHGRHDFPLDEFVFISSCFTHLSLSGCAFNSTGAISWKNLRNLSIAYVKLDEDLIENVLSGSPLLETLVLDYCYGYRRLNITSKSVKNLVFSGYNNFSYALIDPSDIIEINAPNILTLKLQACLALRKLLLLNVSSLVEADLDCMKTSGLFEGHSEEDEEEMLKGFILNLLHVKDLKIGTSCVEVLARLKAKGFNFPSNLKVLDVTSSPNGSAVTSAT